MDKKMENAAEKLAERMKANTAECVKITLSAFKKGEKAYFTEGDTREAVDLKDGVPHLCEEALRRGEWKWEIFRDRELDKAAYGIAAEAYDEYCGIGAAAKEAKATIKEHLWDWLGAGDHCGEDYDHCAADKEGVTSDGTKWWFFYDNYDRECHLWLGEDAEEEVWCGDLEREADDTVGELTKWWDSNVEERDEYGYVIR